MDNFSQQFQIPEPCENTNLRQKNYWIEDDDYPISFHIEKQISEYRYLTETTEDEPSLENQEYIACQNHNIENNNQNILYPQHDQYDYNFQLEQIPKQNDSQIQYLDYQYNDVCTGYKTQFNAWENKKWQLPENQQNKPKQNEQKQNKEQPVQRQKHQVQQISQFEEQAVKNQESEVSVQQINENTSQGIKKNFMKNLSYAFLKYLTDSPKGFTEMLQKEGICQRTFLKKYQPKKNKISCKKKFQQIFFNGKNNKVQQEKKILRIFALKFLREEFFQHTILISHVRDIHNFLDFKHEYEKRLLDQNFI